MKQIKVPLTPKEWAEKRFKAWETSPSCNTSEIDAFIERCGFELIEPETKPDEDQRKIDEIPTDKVGAVKYFLNQLPDGYRERALAQVDEENISVMVNSIMQALREFNVWADTKEGTMFWFKVENHYCYPSKYPTLPPLSND